MNPLSNRTFVQPIPEESKTSSGLSISNAQLQRAKVLFAAYGSIDKPMTVQVGDYILFEKDAGLKYSHNGVEGVFLKEDEIITIL